MPGNVQFDFRGLDTTIYFRDSVLFLSRRVIQGVKRGLLVYWRDKPSAGAVATNSGMTTKTKNKIKCALGKPRLLVVNRESGSLCDLHNRPSIIYSAAHMTFSSFFLLLLLVCSGAGKGGGERGRPFV